MRYSYIKHLLGLVMAMSGLLPVTGFTQTAGAAPAVSIDFVNQSTSTIEVYWVNFDGALEHFGTIPSKTTLRQQSYPNHSWQLKVGSRALGQYRASVEPSQTVTIDATGRLSIGAPNPAPSPQLPGGFSGFRPIDVNTMDVFQRATSTLTGVSYSPLEVASQVVAGTNYRFRCLSKTVTSNPVKKLVIVEIYDPINGNPTVTKITDETGSPVTSNISLPVQGGSSINFRTNSILNTAINPQSPNYAQIQIALAMVTNETREKYGKSQLAISAHLANAAQMHAVDMVKGKFFSHQNNLDRAKADPNARAKMNGVANPIIWENIAQGFGIKYAAGSKVKPLGSGNFSTPEGQLIPEHTPLSLADTLLAIWMKSPPHQKIILSDEAVAIGCGLCMFTDDTFHDMPTVYAVQMIQSKQEIQVAPGY